jgi:hypothetical protein
MLRKGQILGLARPLSSAGPILPAWRRNMIDGLSEEERKYLLLIHANGAIAFVPSVDREVARLLDLGLVQSAAIARDYEILQLSTLGQTVAAGLSL